MYAKVLKAFPYAHDHVAVRLLAVGEVLEIDDGVFEGLEDEKFIVSATEEEIAALQEGSVVVLEPVEIPADWDKLSWFKLRALAEKVSGGKVPKKDLATAVITAELAKRAEA